MTFQTKQRLPDPHGMIAQVRARLNKKCAVRQSQFCDYIISMRMQGIPFRDIEAWLIEQGEIFRISAPTLWRNFKEAKIKVNLTYAEEMIENLGGQINIDLVREMSQNILTQKQRLDKMVRAEDRRRQIPGSENYIDKRIRQEMQAHTEMMAKLHTMLQKAPAEAADIAEQTINKMREQGVKLTPDASAVITDLILNDEIQIGPNELLTSSRPRYQN